MTNEAIDKAHQACAKLRFSTGLRRQWEAARAEAAVWDGQGICALGSIPVTLEQMREIATETQDNLPLQLQAAKGVWAACWTMVSQLPPLNQKSPGRGAVPVTSWPQTLATWHKIIAGGLGVEGAIPSNPAAMAEILKVLTGAESPDAIACAARVYRSFVQMRPFEYGNEAIGVLAAKRLLVLRGIEPTAVAPLGFVLSWPKYREFGSVPAKDVDGVRIFAQVITDACEVGQAIANSVLSATPINSYPHS